MIQTYSQRKNLTYKYTKSGTFNGSISKNVIGISFSGPETKNGIREQLMQLASAGNLTAFLDNCFNGCSQLTSIDLTQSDVSTIGENCFKGCGKLQSINLGNKVAELPPNMAADCPQLTSIVFSFFDTDN